MGGPRFKPGVRHSFSQEVFKFDREQLTEIAIPNLKLVSAWAGAPQLCLKDWSKERKKEPQPIEAKCKVQSAVVNKIPLFVWLYLLILPLKMLIE